MDGLISGGLQTEGALTWDFTGIRSLSVQTYWVSRKHRSQTAALEITSCEKYS